MMNSLGDEGSNQKIREHFIVAAFTTNVLMATAHTLHLCQEEDRFRSIIFSKEVLKKIIEKISNLWMLKPESYSFRAIKYALSNRLIELQQHSELLNNSEISENINQIRDRIPYIGLPLFEIVASALELVNELSNNEGYKWALLFDEFEVAPEPLQALLFGAIRASRSQNVLYKVALAPCGPHTLVEQLENSPSAGNDFKQVELWYANKQEADLFCEQLFLSKFEILSNSSVFSGKTPKEILGDSLYPIVDENGNEEPSTQDLSQKNDWMKSFKALALKDKSFCNYLKKKDINLDELSKSTSNNLGNTIRKISPIVGFRNAYKGKDLKSSSWRKSPYKGNYYGWSSISAISEGNPRWLIGIISGILAEGAQSNSSEIITPNIQGRHITEVSNRFADILRTASTQQFSKLNTSIPIFDLLEKIGNYFHKRVVFDEFSEDPAMSFVVDDRIVPDIENCLRIALNHGAIVCYESADQLGGFHSLKNKRFRLSYLLSPIFSLPIRKSSFVTLSTIINTKDINSEQLQTSLDF